MIEKTVTRSIKIRETVVESELESNFEAFLSSLAIILDVNPIEYKSSFTFNVLKTLFKE